MSNLQAEESKRTTSKTSYSSLQNELSGCIFRHVPGFYSKYFEEKSWTIVADRFVEIAQSTLDSGLCTELLEVRSHNAFLTWFGKFRSVFRTRNHILSQLCIGQISNSGHLLRADLNLVGLGQSTSPSIAASIRVFGELNVGTCRNESEDILRFCESAREIFQAQPTRNFLHGFQVWNSMMELWVFDRSGAYSCKKLDIEKRPDILIRTIASYGMMSNEEVGFNSLIKKDKIGNYIAFSNSEGDNAERFYLSDQPIATPQYIVGPGTTCYAAKKSNTKNAEFVVKFAWREEQRHTECEHLELTKERDVWGVIQGHGWKDLESIKSLRHGLRFTQPYVFPSKATDQKSVTDGNRLSHLTLKGAPDQQFVNRINSCVITSPLGQSISRFQSIPDFLEACRDVAKALRSLYQDGEILHRDIAVKNLIIASQGRDGDAKGVLIDLDMALDLKNNIARKGELVGSEGFMAIGILYGDLHTYRHDLESLFYVFLWVAICNDHEDDSQESLKHLPETSRLRGWCGTNFRSVAQNKSVDMHLDGFGEILNEFSENFKHLTGLAQELRDLLFPIHGSELFTGTDLNQAGAKLISNYIYLGDSIFITALLKDSFLPISVYNSLPSIRDVADVPDKHANDLSLLKSILDKYNLSATVCIKLVHVHFDLLGGEIMTFTDFHVPFHGPIQILGPTKPEPGASFYGSHYFVDDVGELQAWEYMTTKGPDMSKHPDFVKEFCQTVIKRGLQHKFGLSLKPSLGEGGWTEFEYPEKRATFLVPDKLPIPRLENSFNTTTEWPRGPRCTHCHHCTHRPQKQANADSKQEVSGNRFAEGVSSQGGMYLGGVELDPATPFYNVVAAISVAM